MPNWVQHKITVTGTAEQLAAFQMGVRSEPDAEGERDSVFDFNRFIPMPKSLNVEASSEADNAYDAYYGDWQKVVGWPRYAEFKTREELIAEMDKDPKYRTLADTYKHNIETYGCKTWYDWANQNWGTKWNACDSHIENVSETELTLSFDTAWGSPVEILGKMVAQFPELTFVGTVDEEGGYFYLDLKGANGELNIEEHSGTRVGGPYDYGDEDEDEGDGE